MSMTWTPDLNTGIDVIDQQHRQLVNYLNGPAPPPGQPSGSTQRLPRERGGGHSRAHLSRPAGLAVMSPAPL